MLKMAPNLRRSRVPAEKSWAPCESSSKNLAIEIELSSKSVYFIPKTSTQRGPYHTAARTPRFARRGPLGGNLGPSSEWRSGVRITLLPFGIGFIQQYIKTFPKNKILHH